MPQGWCGNFKSQLYVKDCLFLDCDHCSRVRAAAAAERTHDATAAA